MIRIHEHAEDFMEVSQVLLEKKEAENNLMLGLATTLIRNKQYYGELPPIFITVMLDDNCIAACLQTPPYNLIIFGAEEFHDMAIEEIYNYLSENKIEIPGIIGPKDTVQKFINLWTQNRDVTIVDQMDQLVYKLVKIKSVPISNGYLREAYETDMKIVSDCLFKFRSEVIEPITQEAAKTLAKKKIAEGALYLWIDKKPVSMAGWVRPTRNGATISHVYTPLEFRKMGYATSCVAELSKLLLEEYQFCSLFTDAANPTSNTMYQRMGYQQVDQVLYCKFAPNRN